MCFHLTAIGSWTCDPSCSIVRWLAPIRRTRAAAVLSKSACPQVISCAHPTALIAYIRPALPESRWLARPGRTSFCKARFPHV
ncbi:hypothetical protein PsYK624_070660 [Phanerochaete sordida]|uniref:Uncharacterized protein n=1 Tax=Phanerochaete sordida TaxID=48140 RepID=A0A9P3GAC7_9APHY|nr:hypothetical protein PsYK624_070660 [Phanerochaete sordida]